MPINYLIPVAVAQDAGRKGRGVFATEDIEAGTTVAAFGGRMAHRTEFEQMPEYRRTHSLQIDADLFLVCPEEEEPADLFNHSCEPNCGVAGNVLLVAMRDIARGEELTFDYAMSDGSDYDEFACLCEAATCRGTISGSDWRDPELQVRYAGWFSPYLATRIARLSD